MEENQNNEWKGGSGGGGQDKPVVGASGFCSGEVDAPPFFFVFFLLKYQVEF